MKKKFLFLLLVCSILFVGFVKAAEATYKEYGYIVLDDGTDHEFIYRNTNTDDVVTFEGVIYDEESNTLTLNSYKTESCIFGKNMGDFTIKIVGENELGCIHLEANVVDSSLTFNGNGTLKLNSKKTNAYPITARELQITFDKDVTVEINSASEDYLTEHGIDKKYLIRAFSKNKLDPKERIVIKGETSVEPQRNEDLDEDKWVNLYGYTSKYQMDHSYQITVVKDSNNRMRAAWRDESVPSGLGSWKVFYEEIIKCEESKYCFINFRDKIISEITDLDYYTSNYESLDKVKEDYTVVDEDVEIEYVINFVEDLYLRHDEDGKEYGVDDDLVYKVLDEKIEFIYQDQEIVFKKVEKVTSASPAADDLLIPQVVIGYNYYLEGDSLKIAPKKEEANPKTSDSIINYVVILSASLASLYLIKNKRNA